MKMSNSASEPHGKNQLFTHLKLTKTESKPNSNYNISKKMTKQKLKSSSLFSDLDIKPTPKSKTISKPIISPEPSKTFRKTSLVSNLGFDRSLYSQKFTPVVPAWTLKPAQNPMVEIFSLWLQDIDISSFLADLDSLINRLKKRSQYPNIFFSQVIQIVNLLYGIDVEPTKSVVKN